MIQICKARLRLTAKNLHILSFDDVLKQCVLLLCRECRFPFDLPVALYIKPLNLILQLNLGKVVFGSCAFGQGHSYLLATFIDASVEL